MFATAPTGSPRRVDEETVRLHPGDLPVVGKVANTVPQRYVDLSKIQRPPTNWESESATATQVIRFAKKITHSP